MKLSICLISISGNDSGEGDDDNDENDDDNDLNKELPNNGNYMRTRRKSGVEKYSS